MLTRAAKRRAHAKLAEPKARLLTARSTSTRRASMTKKPTTQSVATKKLSLMKRRKKGHVNEPVAPICVSATASFGGSRYPSPLLSLLSSSAPAQPTPSTTHIEEVPSPTRIIPYVESPTPTATEVADPKTKFSILFPLLRTPKEVMTFLPLRDNTERIRELLLKECIKIHDYATNAPFFMPPRAPLHGLVLKPRAQNRQSARKLVRAGPSVMFVY
jgi:hypothetical protein